MSRPSCLLPLLIFCALGLGVRLTAGEGQADAREQCRSQISGNYLGFMNELDMLKATLISTGESNFAMKTRRKVAAKELAAVDAHNEDLKTPAAELDEKVLGLQNDLEMVAGEITDAEARIIEVKAQIATQEKAFRAFKEGIRPVFEVITAKVINTGAYPLLVQYRHPCSRFQQLCPLPAAQSAVLLKLSKQLEDPIPCEHYANMRTNGR